MTTWWRPAAALAAGASLPLAFAPFGWFPPAVAAPALLFLLWRGSSPRAAFRLGWLFGVGQFGVGVSWVFHSINQFGGASWPLAGAFTAALVAFLALYPGLLGAVSRRFFPALDERWRLLALLPAGWMMAEWLRGWLLSGFPWLNLGYSQIDSPLAGLAPIVGVYGVSWATAFTAGAVAALVEGRHRWGVAAAVAALWGGAALVGTVQWSTPAGSPITVALIQGNTAQELKWRPEERAKVLATYLVLTRRHWGSRLILWPETAVPAYYHWVKELMDELAAEAKGHGSEMLVGVPVKEEGSSHYYNAVVALGADDGRYFKRHLVPFGEYIPFKRAVGGLLDLLEIPMSDFSAGTAQQPLPVVAGQPLGISVCYEAAFGEEIIDALPAATLLVNVSNDAWFGDSLAPHQHLEIARMRAREGARWLLRGTNNGISAIIGADGRVTQRSPQFAEAVVTGEVQPTTGATPYVRTGNLPIVLAALVAVMVSLRRQRRK